MSKPASSATDSSVSQIHVGSGEGGGRWGKIVRASHVQRCGSVTHTKGRGGEGVDMWGEPRGRCDGYTCRNMQPAKYDCKTSDPGVNYSSLKSTTFTYVRASASGVANILVNGKWPALVWRVS